MCEIRSMTGSLKKKEIIYGVQFIVHFIIIVLERNVKLSLIFDGGACKHFGFCNIYKVKCIDLCCNVRSG